MTANPSLDDVDQKIVLATQDGLPLIPCPYGAVAGKLGLAQAEVISRLRKMLDLGVIRRIGVVPNHYALGYLGNGMSVWDVADESVLEMGRMVGSLDYVSHCYLRPRILPEWPYNLFAMVHGRDRAEVMERVAMIKALLADDLRAHDVLFSTRILKKTGLRLPA